MSNRNDFVNSLRTMTEIDLHNRMAEDVMRVKKLKFAHAVSPLENPMTIRDVRKDLARIKTELRMRQLAVPTEQTEGTGSTDQTEPTEQTENN